MNGEPIEMIETEPGQWEAEAVVQRREEMGLRIHMLGFAAMCVLIGCVLVATNFR